MPLSDSLHIVSEAHSLPFDPALIAYGGHEERQSYTAMQQVLTSDVDFTAVLASNDESALGAMRALADAGRRIGQDVAVIGFDDVLYAKGQTPPLTTVRHPTFKLGYRAVELLLDYITGARAGIETVRVPTRLIIRESCGCHPYSTPVLRPGRTLVRSSEDLRAIDVPALSQALFDAVAAEAQGSNLRLISEWSEQLVVAWHASLAHHDVQPFTVTLDLLLQAMDTCDEDMYAWQAAIFVLRDHGARQFATQPQQLAESLLDQARVRISERLRRQHTRFLERQAAMTERLGMLTTRLLTALQPEQILHALADHLPAVSIHHASIVLFEAENDNPVAWSNAYVRAAAGPPRIVRFGTRHFPPPDLYPPTEPWSLALLPLIIEGGPTGFVAFDAAYLEPLGLIVRHLAAAFRNTQLHAAAEEGRRQAEEANRLKSRFLATVSHELRTPLNLIVGLSELLLRERPSAPTSADTTVQDLERIFANAQHLGRLIGDVLDLASSEAGQLRLYEEPLDLAEVLQPVVATGRQLAQEKRLAWHAHLPQSRVMQARNGREALALMEQTRPNLVLLDLMMPQLDGFGVLEVMRAHEATRDVPVVVLTAQILTDDDVARLNAGVAALLSKGLFTSDEIVGHIESALARQRKLGTSMHQIVRRAVAFIHTHYAAPITRDQLAAHVGVSGDHLTASFRQDMGITPIAYLNRYRISRARTLLEESSRSVTDIALSVGFADLANFSRMFHREVGLSPNAYRRTKQR